MRLLLTNDDGIAAPGLEALRQAVRRLGEATVLAPVAPCSSCSHQITTHRPVKVFTHGPREIAVEGWPADCVRVGLRGLAVETDWVLSGINAGGNLGADVFLSGTVAAVREAALLGKPGIALSHYKRRDREFDWDRAARWVEAIVVDLTRRPIEPGTFWNVNLPHPEANSPDPDVVFCPLDTNPLPVDYRREGDGFVYVGNYHARPRHPGTDVQVCLAGGIAVSLLRLA
ncbi:MAG: 5'/3'-nucleotidase SurE [Gemmataceae bacterium]